LFGAPCRHDRAAFSGFQAAALETVHRGSQRRDLAIKPRELLVDCSLPLVDALNSVLISMGKIFHPLSRTSTGLRSETK
jgi:hypothetical protein